MFQNIYISVMAIHFDFKDITIKVEKKFQK